MNILVSCHVRWFNAEAFMALTVADLFQRHGHRVLLLTQPDSLLAERSRERGLEVNDELDFLRSNPVSLLRSTLKYCRLFRHFQPDLMTVHRSESFFFTFVARHLSRSRSCIFRFRGDIRSPRRTMFNRWLYSTQCQLVIVPGQVIKTDLLEKLGLADNQIKVMYTPVDTERFSPAPDKAVLKKQWGFDPDRPVIGVVGRIGRVKGHEFLLSAIQSLPDRYRHVQFFIAYHEEHQGVTALKNLVEQMKLADRISFFGYTPFIEKLIAAADIGAICSIGSEANCRVALEFMACGIPLVATNVGIIPEVVQHGVTGFIVPPRQPWQTAERLVQFLDDGNLCRDMGDAARTIVEQRFSPHIFFDTLRALIQERCPNL